MILTTRDPPLHRPLTPVSTTVDSVAFGWSDALCANLARGWCLGSQGLIKVLTRHESNMDEALPIAHALCEHEMSIDFVTKTYVPTCTRSTSPATSFSTPSLLSHQLAFSRIFSTRRPHAAPSYTIHRTAPPRKVLRSSSAGSSRISTPDAVL